MKAFFYLLTLISLTANSFCQLFHVDPADKEYYLNGTLLLKQGLYAQADSLFTLSLRTFRNKDVFYNRALSKLFQTDTAGYCSDLYAASNMYYDDIAENDFIKNCCTQTDTVYFDKKYNVCTSAGSRYYEIMKKFKYESRTEGRYYDNKEYKGNITVDFSTGGMTGINSASHNIIASYFFEDSVKYFNRSTAAARITDPVKYEDLKRRAKILLNVKYGTIKKNNNLDNISVYYRVYCNDQAEMIKVKFLTFIPAIADSIPVAALEADLFDIVRYYPKVSPAKLFKENINCVFDDSVEF